MMSGPIVTQDRNAGLSCAKATRRLSRQTPASKVLTIIDLSLPTCVGCLRSLAATIGAAVCVKALKAILPDATSKYDRSA